MRRKPGTGKRPLAAGDTEMIRELIDAGYTTEEISDRLDIQASSVRGAIKRTVVDEVAVERALQGDRAVYEQLTPVEHRALSVRLGEEWRHATPGEREAILDRGELLGEDRNAFERRAMTAALRGND